MIFYYEPQSIYVFYEIIGKGKPLVFLHGWGSSRTYFYPITNIVDYKCILIDLPPFGKSDKYDNIWNMQIYCDLIKNLLYNIGVTSADFVVHSFGCRIALELAKERFQIKKLVIMAGAGIESKSVCLKLKITRSKIAKFLNRNLGTKFIIKGSSDYNLLKPNMQATFSNIVRYDQKKLLKCVHSKTLLIWGRLDNSTPLKDAKTMKKNIENSELVIIENCGHFALLDKPQIATRIINNFLEE